MQKQLIFIWNYARIEVKSVKKLSDPIKICLMTIIAAAVAIVLIKITHSACAVWFSQPEQPTEMPNVVKLRE